MNRVGLVLVVLVGSGQDLVIAGATLVAAGAFNPVRRWMQRLVDGRFNRSRFDAQIAVDDFGAALSTTPDLDSALSQLTRPLQQTVQPTATSIWIPRRPS